MSKRALRRHHRQRIINKFRRLTSHWYMFGNDEMWIKKTAAKGSIGCGCSMCANPRRKHSIECGKITDKEKLNFHYFKHWKSEHYGE